ncbi:MAG: PEPxxWA-CTERM sorting domain-containing protein [Sphingomonadales bacterium]
MHIVAKAAVVSVILAMPTMATTVFSNNFDTDNAGVSALNFNGFTGLTPSAVTSPGNVPATPQVNLVHTGDGNGATCLSGGCMQINNPASTSTIVKSLSFAFQPNYQYALTFDYLSNGNGYAQFEYYMRVAQSDTFGTFGNGATIFADNFTTTGQYIGFAGYDYGYYATGWKSARLAVNTTATGSAFVTIGLHGDYGASSALVDNVRITSMQLGAAVPEPASWAMLIAGFGLAGGAMRRRRLVQA